jgi:hypothetical protein
MRELPNLPNVFIAGGYKTGSTHIGLSLSRLVRYRRASVIDTRGSIGDEDQRIDKPAANILFPMGGMVFQNHVRASPSNLPILQEHGIRPVIITRNILDSLVSIHRRFNEVEEQEWRAQPSKGWRKMNENQQWKWLAYNVAPWMMSFYVSWLKADIPKLFVTYEGWFKDQVGGTRGILDHVGLSKLGTVTDEEIVKCTEHRDGNFSGSGVSGRGRKEIPIHIRAIIEDQAKAWGPRWCWDLECLV